MAEKKKSYNINPKDFKTPVTITSTKTGPMSHPVYTRYPHLKDKGPTDAHYSEWQKWFAWKPVKCLDGEKVWLRTIYKRSRTVKWTPPQFPPDAFNRTEYSTWEGILNMRMRDEFKR